jgi:hypothetical protein
VESLNLEYRPKEAYSESEIKKVSSISDYVKKKKMERLNLNLVKIIKWNRIFRWSPGSS